MKYTCKLTYSKCKMYIQISQKWSILLKDGLVLTFCYYIQRFSDTFGADEKNGVYGYGKSIAAAYFQLPFHLTTFTSYRFSIQNHDTVPLWSTSCGP